MKKLLLLLAAVGMIFTACEGGESVEEDNGGAPFVPEITISPKDLTFGCNGGEQAVDITANFEYEVAKRASWVTVEQTDEGLLVIVDANKNTSERSAFISITNSQYDINKSIEVYQESWVPKIELAQQSIEVEFEPAQYTVDVNSPYSWEATSKNEWIVVESETGIAGEEKLKFTTLRNEEEQERKGTITLKNTDYNLVAELYVIQKPFVPTMTIQPESLIFDSEGGMQEIAITANFEYQIIENSGWLSCEKTDKGINVTASLNTKFEERTAEFSIFIEKYGVSKTILVTQKGVSAESQNVIFYTSSDGKIVTPNKSDVFGANIVSNTYSDEQGFIVFDAPITSIGEEAFLYCTSLTTITIPDSVTLIEEHAFYSCTSLTTITIPDSVTLIEEHAFYSCTSLTSVTIPDSVTSIGSYAFTYCSSLTSVTIGNSVTSIGRSAFRDCTSLKAFYGKYASSDNRCLIVDGVLNSFAPAGLTEYTIPDSVTSIGYQAFCNCTSLTSVTIPNSVTEIGEVAFYNCTSLTSVTIGNSVTSIGERSFSYCTSLTSVTIGNSVTSIGEEAFLYCTSLTSVTIGNSVTSIGAIAFFNCTSLKSITIPDSVTSIGDWAFCDCTSLKEVYCKAATPPTGGSSMFSTNASGRKIYVPTASVEAYKSADGWKYYADYIEGYDF